MADPTTPTTPGALTPDQVALADQLAQSYSVVNNNASTMDTVMNKLGSTMNQLNDALAANQISLNDLSSLTNQQINEVTLITTGFIKAREAFTGFANVDTRGLSTFSDQLKDIKDALFSGGTAASAAARSLENLAKSMFGDAAASNIMNEARKKGQQISTALLESLEKEGAGVIMHADNMLRLQNAYIQMSASTGRLDDLWKKAGPDLENLNVALAQQTQMLGDTIQATGLNGKQVEEYFGQLGQIPGAMEQIVATSGKAGSGTSMLTATIQAATGMGRKYEDVMTDLKTAFKDYGLVGEDALRFSVRMGDVSTRLKAPIEDVTNALRGSADAFKMFATGQDGASKSAESLAKTLNTYGKALESTGLSASASVEIAGQLSSQVAKLSLGQQAFISQQTGGAGGLMGAAQETLKLQNDPGAVVRDAMDTLKKQFGTIMTVKDAAQSEAAASQWVKQTAMLQTLLGPLAKDQATANRLLEAMKNQGEGNPAALADALKPTGVQDAEDKGLKLQQQSYSAVSKMRGDVERLRYLADQGSGKIVQGAMTASSMLGNATPTAAQTAVHTGLQESMLAARAKGAETNYEIAQGNKGTPTDLIGVHAAETLTGAAQSLGELPTTVKSVLDTLKMGLESPSQQVGNAARASVAAQPPGASAHPANTTTPQGPGANINGQQHINITGKFTIDCPNCGRPTDVSDQAKINPQQFGR